MTRNPERDTERSQVVRARSPSLIARHGRFALLQKRDLKDAFRKIPVSPYDHWLLLFEWDGQIYTDLRLPFGLSTAPFIFNYFSEGLHWILSQVYSLDVAHYLDDFLIIGSDDWSLFNRICTTLGLEEKTSKSINGYVVDFTGIELDSDKMEARLPKEKHDRAITTVSGALAASKAGICHKTLDSLLGYLSFCTRVIPLGRPFLRNIYNFLNDLSYIHPLATRPLPQEATTDLRWWLTFLKNWSGIRLIRANRPIHYVYTDASGSKGIGGWHGASAFSMAMPRRHRTKHIDWKEAYAILFALAKWGEKWKGLHIVFMCDNSAIVDALHKRSIRGEAITPLQLILLTAALYDIEVSSRWLSSEENWIADALSRFNLTRLTYCKLDQLFGTSLSRRESGEPMVILRRKLHIFFATDLPSLQEQHMQQPGQTTNDIQVNTDIKRSL